MARTPPTIAQSGWATERGIRRRKLRWLLARVKEISKMELQRDGLLMKLGAARAKAPAA
jgi:hypothetical protein